MKAKVKIGLLFKPDLRETDQILSTLKEIEKDRIVCFEIIDTSYFRLSTFDFILAFGGDGTMLHSVEYSLRHNAPVLGINLGKLGFLSDSSLKELKNAISDLINHKYRLESRMLLEVKVYRENKIIDSGIALNDVVLFKGSDDKLVNLKLYANKQFVYATRSDGIVISSPTGSTAYNLAAGGPIISPAMHAVIVTPLNPHILTVRPMVFDDTETIEVRLPAGNMVHLQIDGVNKCELHINDKIVVKKSKQMIQFVKLSQKTFYKILRQKLKMGKI